MLGIRVLLFVAIAATIGCDRVTKHVATTALAQHRAKQPLIRHRHAVRERQLRRQSAHHRQSGTALQASLDRHVVNAHHRF